MTTDLPPSIEHWTADEAAECLDGLSNDLRSRLWGFLSVATSHTPLGGDGCNGTTETPDGRLDPDNDDKAPHWWSRLTDDDRAVIAAAIQDNEIN